MLIEKEKIQKAKEKLGDRNAELIAEIMDLQGYDAQHHKSLCPLHSEDTPSFVYDPKRFRFHCFGCGKNVDLITAYMSNGDTYIEAVQKLFAEANVKYAFGEHHIKDKRDYRYPVLPPDSDCEAAYSYLELRKISRKTAKHCGIRQDEHGNIAFCYFDLNDVLKMVKYRPSHKVNKGENKCWVQKNTDSQPLLFNMNRINVNEPLIICEGEGDCMAVIESGHINATSVPFGAHNTHWIEENFEWLEQFDSIIICPDNDAAGQEMVKNIVPRLGSWRVKVVHIPDKYTKEDGTTVSIKDANELLFWGGKEALSEAVVNAEDTPVPSMVDFADVEDINLSALDGIHIGIHKLDQELLKLFYGTFTVVSGQASAGKSSFLFQILCNAMEDDVNCWLFSKEMPSWLSRNWAMHILSGRRNVEPVVDPYSGAISYEVKRDVRKKIGDHYRGKLMLYRDDYPNDYESILAAMVDSRRKYGARVFVVDNMMMVDLKGNDENKYEKQTFFCNELINFAVKYNACVILVDHPRKLNDPNMTMGLQDLAGSSNIGNLAHRAITLKRVSEAEKQGIMNRTGDGYIKPPNPYSVMVTVLKDRMRGRNGLTVGMHYDVPSRRFFTNEAEFSRQFSWDTTKYEDDIPYPIDEREEAVFGKVH